MTIGRFFHLSACVIRGFVVGVMSKQVSVIVYSEVNYLDYSLFNKPDHCSLQSAQKIELAVLFEL